MTGFAHHGYGEEMLPALLASGGTAVGVLVLMTKARLARMARWLRRR